MQARIAALIADVKALDAQATPGPWHDRDSETENGYSTSAISPDSADEDGLSPADLSLVGRTIADGLSAHDAALIAHYRNTTPLLAAEVERQDEEIRALRAGWQAEREAAQRAQNLLAAERAAWARQEAELRATKNADLLWPHVKAITADLGVAATLGPTIGGVQVTIEFPNGGVCWYRGATDTEACVAVLRAIYAGLRAKNEALAADAVKP